MKIALIAGEVSGDQLGSELAKSLFKVIPDIEISGITGKKMEEAGVVSIASINNLSAHGLLEVAPKLWQIYKFRSWLIKKLLSIRPDWVIGIDAPDFNLGLLQQLKKNNINTIQYVAPTVWAWRPWRINKLKDSVHNVLTLFPFEAELLQQRDIAAKYYGHPLAREIPLIPSENYKQRKRIALGISPKDRIITLLPGSRTSELIRHANILLESARILQKKLKEQNKDEVVFYVALADEETKNIFIQQTQNQNYGIEYQVVVDKTNDILAVSHFCIAASGTVCLQAALHHLPMVIYYQMNPFTFWFAKLLYKLPWIGLPNILLEKTVVPELIQNEATAQKIADTAYELFTDKFKQSEIKNQFVMLHKSLITNPTIILKQFFTTNG